MVELEYSPKLSAGKKEYVLLDVNLVKGRLGETRVGPSSHTLATAGAW